MYNIGIQQRFNDATDYKTSKNKTIKIDRYENHKNTAFVAAYFIIYLNNIELVYVFK